MNRQTIDDVDPPLQDASDNLGEPGAEDLKEIQENIDHGDEGRYRSEYPNNPFYTTAFSKQNLTRDQVLELYRRYHAGDETALNILTEHNLRFAIWWSRKFQNRGVDFDDLVQVACDRLVHGLRRYNPHDPRGASISTYVTWWIKQGLKRTIEQQRNVIRLKSGALKKMGLISKTARILEQKFGRRPTLEEISSESGLSVDELKQAFQYGRAVSSLDQPMESHTASTSAGAADDFHSVIADQNCPDPSLLICAREELTELAKKVQSFMAKVLSLDFIKEHHLRMFMRFHGLTGARLYNTLDLTAEEFGVTREAIRQVNLNVWHNLYKNFPNLEFDESTLLHVVARL